MSSAWLTACATLVLASKVWGSVLGLFRIDDTLTYLPPIWLSTLAYSFSAPTALITLGLVVLAEAPVPLVRRKERPRSNTVALGPPRASHQRIGAEVRDEGSMP